MQKKDKGILNSSITKEREKNDNKHIHRQADQTPQIKRSVIGETEEYIRHLMVENDGTLFKKMVQNNDTFFRMLFVSF